MAKVRSPLHSIDLRGRIADGFVFTVWRGINCLRTFVMPSQPRTQRKEQVEDHPQGDPGLGRDHG